METTAEIVALHSALDCFCLSRFDLRGIGNVHITMSLSDSKAATFWKVLKTGAQASPWPRAAGDTVAMTMAIATELRPRGPV